MSDQTYDDGFEDGKKVERQRIIDMLLITDAAFTERTGNPGAWELEPIISLIQVEEEIHLEVIEPIPQG